MIPNFPDMSWSHEILFGKANPLESIKVIHVKKNKEKCITTPYS